MKQPTRRHRCNWGVDPGPRQDDGLAQPLPAIPVPGPPGELSAALRFRDGIGPLGDHRLQLHVAEIRCEGIEACGGERPVIGEAVQHGIPQRCYGRVGTPSCQLCPGQEK